MRRWITPGLALLVATAVLVTDGTAGWAPTSPASAAASPASQTGPAVSTTQTRASVGQSVEFTVTGFRAETVRVELCSQGRGAGSTACDIAGGGLAVVTGAGARRAGTAVVTLAGPPGGCPCVIRATGVETRERAALPFAVTGVASSEPKVRTPPPEEPVVLVTAVVPERDWPGRLAAWTGLSRERRIDVAVRNAGSAPLRDATLDLQVGRSATGGQQTAATVDLPDLEPGAATAVRVDLALSESVALGRYAISGTVTRDGGGQPVAGGVVGTSVSTLPVVAIAAGCFLLLWAGLTALRRAARRRARRGGRHPVSLGLPWLTAAAGTILVVACGLGIQAMWTDWRDADAAANGRQDLVEQFAEQAPPAARRSRSRPAPETGDLIGVLRLPALGSDQVYGVVEGVVPDQLRRGPGHFPGTALPGQVGNLVIAGHSGIDQAPFDALPTLETGDEVLVEDGRATFRYLVTGVRRVPASATDVLLPVRSRPGVEPRRAQLTLITCAYEQSAVSGRWVVEAELAGRAREG